MTNILVAKTTVKAHDNRCGGCIENEADVMQVVWTPEDNYYDIFMTNEQATDYAYSLLAAVASNKERQ